MQPSIQSFARCMLLLFALPFAGSSQQLRPGVLAGNDLSAFPLPVSGYDVYMIGELHGVKQTEGVLVQYLTKLYEGAGLRDVALEEKSAYQHDAQAYIDGQSTAVPEPLCLRAGILTALRRFNEGRQGSAAIRIHLVDIDINPTAVHDHLLSLKQRIPGTGAIRAPLPADIKARGLETVAALRQLTSDPQLSAELRTVQHSIRALQQGLEAGTGPTKGSPYLDDREDAIVSNLMDIVRKQADTQPARTVLALYGSDHVSKTPLHNGGPKQDTDFSPAALRLERAGIKVFSMVTLPLNGRSNWRGREAELMWTASDGSLSSGETLDTVLAATPASTLLFIDPKREPVKLPSQDLTRSRADAFLLLARGTSAENRCAAR
jgi:hypothetical protein